MTRPEQINIELPSELKIDKKFIIKTTPIYGAKPPYSPNDIVNYHHL